MKGPISVDRLDRFNELAEQAIQKLKPTDELSMYGLSLIMAKNYFVKRMNHQSGCFQSKNAITKSYHRISHDMTTHGVSPMLRSLIWDDIRDLVRNKPITQSTLQKIVSIISSILISEGVSPFSLEEVEEFC